MSSFFDSGLNAISDGEIDYLGDDMSIVLVSDFPVESGTVGADFSFLDDLSTYVIGSPEVLVSKTRGGGAHRSDPVVFTAVPGVDIVNAVVIFKDTGSGATSQLIGFASRKQDTTPIEIETNGDNITVIFADSIVYTI